MENFQRNISMSRQLVERLPLNTGEALATDVCVAGTNCFVKNCSGAMLHDNNFQRSTVTSKIVPCVKGT